jgi:hypothetical protein
MSAPKHTPGPWKIVHPKRKVVVGDRIVIEADRGKNAGRLVAVLYAAGWAGAPQWAADAHLIVAAPELLEALKAVRAAKCGTLAMAKAFEACDLAIAKAEGA